LPLARRCAAASSRSYGLIAPRTPASCSAQAWSRSRLALPPLSHRQTKHRRTFHCNYRFTIRRNPFALAPFSQVSLSFGTISFYACYLRYTFNRKTCPVFPRVGGALLQGDTGMKIFISALL